MYLTSDIPGVGGIIRTRPEDFLVEEQPLFPPSTSGEHLLLFVQKRELSTHDLVDILARHFSVPRRALGFAGQKDKFAITRQHVSVHVPGKSLADFPMLQHPNVSVLWADHHSSKLRLGQLAGNRFSIKIRDVSPTSVLVVDRILKILLRRGVPNRFGPQRFGITGANHIVGRHLILADYPEAIRAMLAPAPNLGDQQTAAREHFSRGEYAQAAAALRGWNAEKSLLTALSKNIKAADAIRRLDARDLTIYLNAWQSAVFNDVLDRRIQSGTFDQLLPGDLAIKHDSDAVFAVADAADPALSLRLATFDLSPSGPMWAKGMLRAAGQVDALEVESLESRGMTLADLDRYAARPLEGLAGQRRPLRMPLRDVEYEGGVDEFGAYIRLAFDLPKGGFATSVLEEVMKLEA